MTIKGQIKNFFTYKFVNRYRFGQIFYISLSWTILDILIFFSRSQPKSHSLSSPDIALRALIIFFSSLLMGYLLVFKLKKLFRNKSLVVSIFFRSVILLSAAYIISFILHLTEVIANTQISFLDAISRYGGDAFQVDWLVQKMVYWMALFLITQLIIEVNEKYSPGVFFDLLLGKYLEPKMEKRIIMFLDLKDSTPIAEKLGHQQYFKFIREFIYQISNALIEHHGNIYQYVGDEVIVSWPYTMKNTQKCIDALIEARKNLQQRSEHFRRRYGQNPEFRVGIHAGDVTVGEIGVIKKDIAMSGDTMNTTARIRSACSELNQKYIVSRDFKEMSDLKVWHTESLGIIELKGKAEGIELFTLQI